MEQDQRRYPRRPLAVDRDVPTRSSLPPEFVEDTRPAGRGVKPNGAEAGKPKAPAELEPVQPGERSVPLTDIQSPRAGLQELLRQVGLDSLRLPPNSILSPQWRDFLEQLKSANGRLGSREFRGRKNLVNSFSRGQPTSLQPRPEPSELSPEQQAEARVTPGDSGGPPGRNAPPHRVEGEGLDHGMREESMTKAEREGALLTLMQEGHKMPPSKAALIAKVTEMRKKAGMQRSNSSPTDPWRGTCGS